MPLYQRAMVPKGQHRLGGGHPHQRGVCRAELRMLARGCGILYLNFKEITWDLQGWEMVKPSPWNLKGFPKRCVFPHPARAPREKGRATGCVGAAEVPGLCSGAAVVCLAGCQSGLDPAVHVISGDHSLECCSCRGISSPWRGWGASHSSFILIEGTC